MTRRALGRSEPSTRGFVGELAAAQLKRGASAAEETSEYFEPALPSPAPAAAPAAATNAATDDAAPEPPQQPPLEASPSPRSPSISPLEPQKSEDLRRAQLRLAGAPSPGRSPLQPFDVKP